MKPFKQTLMSGAIMLALSLAFTSCDDILGEWDKPTPVTPGGGSGEGGGSDEGGGGTTPSATKTAGSISYASATFKRGTADPAFIIDLTNTGDGAVTYESSDPAVATVDPSTGKVTPVAIGSTTITATVSDSEGYTYATKTASYNLTLESGISCINASGISVVVDESGFTAVTNGGAIDMTETSKPYLVKGTVNVGDITASSTSVYYTEIVLCDGAELIVTGKISGKYLKIYAQSNGANMGKLTVTNSAGNAIENTGSLYFYGGKITATYTSASGCGINASSLCVYGGEVKAQGGPGGHGVLYAGAGLYLKNGKLEAIGGDNAGGTGGNGIHSTGGAPVRIQNNNGVLKAQGGSGTTGGNGVDVSDNASDGLYYQFGQFTAIGGTGTIIVENGQGIKGNLTNGSGAKVTFRTSTDGTNWPENMYFGLEASAHTHTNDFGIRKIN